MIGMVLTLLGATSSRFLIWGTAFALWLLRRPGGWAVVAFGALVWAQTIHHK